MKFNIYDYQNKPTKIDTGKRPIAYIEVSVISGDEVVEVHYTNGLSKRFDSSDTRWCGFLDTDSRVGSAGAWGTNIGIDVTYQGKRITAQDTFVMHCSEENIRYAEEQVKMFEEVYNKVKEIYSDEG